MSYYEELEPFSINEDFDTCRTMKSWIHGVLCVSWPTELKCLDSHLS